MKMNFTESQVKWASQHDWFLGGDSNYIVCRGEYGDQRVSFTNFKQLRDWAGY